VQGCMQAEDTFKKEKFVLSVAQSPDGRWLASGSMDGTVAVFDAATGQLLHTLDGHFKPVRSLCFTPGARLLIVTTLWLCSRVCLGTAVCTACRTKPGHSDASYGAHVGRLENAGDSLR